MYEIGKNILGYLDRQKGRKLKINLNHKLKG